MRLGIRALMQALLHVYGDSGNVCMHCVLLKALICVLASALYLMLTAKCEATYVALLVLTIALAMKAATLLQLPRQTAASAILVFARQPTKVFSMCVGQ